MLDESGGVGRGASALSGRADDAQARNVTLLRIHTQSLSILSLNDGLLDTCEQSGEVDCSHTVEAALDDRSLLEVDWLEYDYGQVVVSDW